MGGLKKMARLLQIVDLVIEADRHLDIANLDRGMGDTLVVITLEAIILDLGVAANAAAVMVARSKWLQVRHGKIGIQQMPDGYQIVVRENSRATFRIPKIFCFQLFEFPYRPACNPALIKIKVQPQTKPKGSSNSSVVRHSQCNVEG